MAQPVQEAPHQMGEERRELSRARPAGLLHHGLQEDNFGIGSYGAPSESSVANAGQPPPQAAYPVSLNTVAYADHAVGQNSSLPDPAVLGSEFKVVGVQIIKPPSNDTVPTGAPAASQVTYKSWGVEIYISDGAFVNGSTTSS